MGEDEHIMEAIGKAKIVVRGGKVVEVGTPLLTQCPLAKRFAKPVDTFTPDAIRANIEDRIKNSGMFTKKRVMISSDDFVVFGASELISTGMKAGLLDAAVIACDGAGTVIVNSPELVQGIGGKMSGLVKTSPIPEVIAGLEGYGAIVPNPKTAAIDQVSGVRKARDCGLKRIAVTVTSPDDAELIRKEYSRALIFGVHLTGISKEGAERMAAVADIVTGCASKWIREAAANAALLQAGVSVPVFALTEKGKELIAAKVKTTKQHLLIKVERLPFTGGKCPDLV